MWIRFIISLRVCRLSVRLRKEPNPPIVPGRGVLRCPQRLTQSCPDGESCRLPRRSQRESCYDVALQVIREPPYRRWREANPEDALRFHALRLHEAGMIKTTPDQLTARGTDWSFLEHLKQELKA